MVIARRLIWHETPPAGMGCSVCTWRFVIPPDLPPGAINGIIHELKEQCDDQFAKHRCEEYERS